MALNPTERSASAASAGVAGTPAVPAPFPVGWPPGRDGASAYRTAGDDEAGE